MFCPNCGCWNPDDSKFCSACATSMQAPTGTAAPANAVSSSNSFVERWRKIAVSPILLVLAAVLTLQAILSVTDAFDAILYGFEGLSYSFFAALVVIAKGVQTLAVLLLAVGLWLTYVDGMKKDSAEVNPLGISLTRIGVLVQLICGVVVAVGTFASLADLGALGYLISDSDGIAGLIGTILGMGLALLYYFLLFGAANGAMNAATTKTSSITKVGGAAIMSYVFAAFFLLYYVIINHQTDLVVFLQIGTMLVQGLALSQYKSEMSK